MDEHSRDLKLSSLIAGGATLAGLLLVVGSMIKDHEEFRKQVAQYGSDVPVARDPDAPDPEVARDSQKAYQQFQLIEKRQARKQKHLAQRTKDWIRAVDSKYLGSAKDIIGHPDAYCVLKQTPKHSSLVCRLGDRKHTYRKQHR